MEYIALIHKDADHEASREEWDSFFKAAGASGMFRGGSAIGHSCKLGEKEAPSMTEYIGGFMRFDTDELAKLLELLAEHPVTKHGGTIELCEMPLT
ncbi:MAG: hypothetical protein H6822_32295 [Planctomycetaceae bacterium]|nr:hypothetical protein [Planctomycetales bacterium]MCB9926866.1 hypothetical protein [Planctomycetaceae bacterium]